MLTRPEFKISLENLADNYRVLKNKTGARPAAVVKADAYGLGASKVAQRLVREGCNAFFVAHAFEGAVVRSVAEQADIYVLQGIGEDSVADFKKCRLTPVIANPQMLAYWNTLGITNVRPIIQVETGLNRLGFRMSDAAALSQEQIGRFSYMLSHLACVDEHIHFMNARQREAFEAWRAKLKLPATFSASDGVFLGTPYHYDMVRLGAALYGLNVEAGKRSALKTVAFVRAPVLQISDVPAGDYIGYGATFAVTSFMRIAVVSIGYADGLMRSLSNRGQVRINGVRAPIVGRISMDNVMCDVSSVPHVQVGDMADILDDVYRADDMAADAGTIGYEILTTMGQGKRFCRSYIG